MRPRLARSLRRRCARPIMAACGRGASSRSVARAGTGWARCSPPRLAAAIRMRARNWSGSGGSPARAAGARGGGAYHAQPQDFRRWSSFCRQAPQPEHHAGLPRLGLRGHVEDRRPAYDAGVKEALGLEAADEIAGFPHIGTLKAMPEAPARLDPADFVKAWTGKIPCRRKCRGAPPILPVIARRPGRRGDHEYAAWLEAHAKCPHAAGMEFCGLSPRTESEGRASGFPIMGALEQSSCCRNPSAGTVFCYAGARHRICSSSALRAVAPCRGSPGGTIGGERLLALDIDRRGQHMEKIVLSL